MVLLVDNHLWREIVQGSTECVTSRGRRMHCPAKVRNFQRVFQADQDVLRLDVSVNDVFRMTVLDSLTRGTGLLPLHKSESKQRSLLEQLVPPPSAWSTMQILPVAWVTSFWETRRHLTLTRHLGEGTAALQQSIELPTRCHFEAKVDSLPRKQGGIGEYRWSSSSATRKLIMEEGVESQDVHMPTVRLNLDLSPSSLQNPKEHWKMKLGLIHWNLVTSSQNCTYHTILYNSKSSSHLSWCSTRCLMSWRLSRTLRAKMKPAQHHISEISEYLSFHRLQTNENVSHGNVKFESPLVTCSSTTSHINCAELPGTQALANVDILSGPCEGKRCEDIFCPDLFHEMMEKKIGA